MKEQIQRMHLLIDANRIIIENEKKELNRINDNFSGVRGVVAMREPHQAKIKEARAIIDQAEEAIVLLMEDTLSPLGLREEDFQNLAFAHGFEPYC